MMPYLLSNKYPPLIHSFIHSFRTLFSSHLGSSNHIVERCFQFDVCHDDSGYLLCMLLYCIEGINKKRPVGYTRKQLQSLSDGLLHSPSSSRRQVMGSVERGAFDL